MKKKIIGIAVAASLMLTGVVSAASVWGTYKGNDIIRITSNGAAIKATDVPAINYNGRTMIPINMLGQLGIPYTWNQSNKTVDVQIKTDSSESIKNFVAYADYFNTLEALGNSLSGLSDKYFTAARAIVDDSKDSAYLDTVNGLLNTFIDLYNSTVNLASDFPDSEVNNILLNYYNSIEYYKKMDSALYDFKNSRNSASMDLFGTNNSLGLDSSKKGSFAAIKKYQQYIDLALNAK
jgi:hypothetical protein